MTHFFARATGLDAVEGIAFLKTEGPQERDPRFGDPNAYELSRYEPEWDYYSYGDTIQYAYVRDRDDDYFGLHNIGDIVINPEWEDAWTNDYKKPECLPIYKKNTEGTE
jgi:hypothetical protein